MTAARTWSGKSARASLTSRCARSAGCACPEPSTFPQRTALLVAQPREVLDQVVLLVVAHRHGRKVRFLSQQSLHDRPVLSWFLRAGRHIPVVQDAPSRAARRRPSAPCGPASWS